MAYSVTQLNNLIKDYLDINPSLKKIQVIGEISNLKKHYTGHWYLTLKDENSRINAMVFSSYASRIKIKVEDGMKVMVTGSISVYAQGGSYQIYITDIDPIGVGALYLQYEQLKKKLAEEGLLDPQNKKNIPAYPNNIGVISAPQGAAVRDVITTIRRRWPVANITLLSALVQGASAAPDVLDKLIKADNMGFDTIIIARGGGSIEDLWCFNDESVARFVANMKTPTISAIGHETDFTILDFVADRRAATPTAAAEIATPNIYEVLINVESHANRMKNKLIAKFDFYNEAIRRIKSRNWFTNPEMLYVNKHLQCNSLVQRLNDSTKNKFVELHKTLEKSRIVMKNSLVSTKEKKKHEYLNLVSTLDALSPLKVINRGYSIVEAKGKTINSIEHVNINDELKIRLKDGRVSAKVMSKEDGNYGK